MMLAIQLRFLMRNSAGIWQRIRSLTCAVPDICGIGSALCEDELERESKM